MMARHSWSPGGKPAECECGVPGWHSTAHCSTTEECRCRLPPRGTMRPASSRTRPARCSSIRLETQASICAHSCRQAPRADPGGAADQTAEAQEDRAVAQEDRAVAQ